MTDEALVPVVSCRPGCDHLARLIVDLEELASQHADASDLDSMTVCEFGRDALGRTIGRNVCPCCQWARRMVETLAPTPCE